MQTVYDPVAPVPPPAHHAGSLGVDLTPPIILFGRDERHRPHASRFDGDERGGVEEAARLMGLHVATADTDTLRALADRLPEGRLFPSGRGFVPFVKTDLYDRLLKAIGTPDRPRPVAAAAKPAEGGSGAGAGSGPAAARMALAGPKSALATGPASAWAAPCSPARGRWRVGGTTMAPASSAKARSWFGSLSIASKAAA